MPFPDLAGGPLLDWAWLKAFLPSSKGGLGIQCATLYAPTSFLASSHQSRKLVATILGQVLDSTCYLGVAMNDLCVAVGS